eukprot:m.163360 g.163360  ORF g.163360 m.163360 type:complete len:113 (+) comp14632_c0_seq1:3272-3610(+)
MPSIQDLTFPSLKTMPKPHATVTTREQCAVGGNCQQSDTASVPVQCLEQSAVCPRPHFDDSTSLCSVDETRELGVDESTWLRDGRLATYHSMSAMYISRVTKAIGTASCVFT